MKYLIRSMLVAAVCLAPGLARAQAGPEFGVSYSFLHLNDAEFEMPVGFLASGGQRFGSWATVVGEFGGSYKSEDGETLLLHTLQGGLRASPAAGRTRPYGQILAGMAIASCCGESQLRPMLEPGGGVDVQLSPRVAIRAGLGVPVIFSDGERATAVRATVGFVFTPRRR